MLSKLTLAGGVLGVASLAFVGVGGYALDTSSVAVNNSFSSGTFQLQVVPGTATVSGQFIHDANSAGQPTQTESATPEPTLLTGNTLNYSLANAAPGDTYSYTFTVYDVGTLQGQVNQITYAPSATGAGWHLLNHTTVEVSVESSSGWVPLTDSNSGGSDTTGPLAAVSPETFLSNYSSGPNFLQPNSFKNGAWTYNGDENSVTYQVTFAISSNAGNNSEGGSASAQFVIGGANTP